MKTEISSNWSHAVLICKKCGKKSAKRGGGFGPKGDRLPKALRKELHARKGRKGHIGIVEVPCLDICPKRGVVAIDTRKPDKWRIIEPGADIAELAADYS